MIPRRMTRAHSHARPAPPATRQRTAPRGPLPVLYKSAALAATSPALSFRRRPSARIAAAAAAADACRERFKAEREAAAERVGAPRAGEPAERASERQHRRRLLLNRCSASASRLRKEAYCSALEGQLAELEGMYNELVEKVRSLRGEAGGDGAAGDVRDAVEVAMDAALGAALAGGVDVDADSEVGGDAGEERETAWEPRPAAGAGAAQRGSSVKSEMGVGTAARPVGDADIFTVPAREVEERIAPPPAEPLAALFDDSATFDVAPETALLAGAGHIPDLDMPSFLH